MVALCVGTTFLCSVLIAPVKNENNDVILFILNLEDITDAPAKTDVQRQTSKKPGLIKAGPENCLCLSLIARTTQTPLVLFVVALLYACTHNRFAALWIFSGSTRVSRYTRRNIHPLTPIVYNESKANHTNGV